MDEDSIKLLSDNKVLIRELHESLPTLEAEFLKIQYLSQKSVTEKNFNAAITSFYNIFMMIPLMKSKIEAKITPLFRARANERKNELFSHETDISYNSSNIKGIAAGRFNKPQESVFYASLSVENSNIRPEIAACLETCKRLTDSDYPIYLKDFTIGRWQVERSFYVLNLCFDIIHLKGNVTLKEATEEYVKNIKALLTEESSTFIIKFLSFFSAMSGRKSLTNNEYYILTALLYAVQYYYLYQKKEKVYGLVYPGAGTEARGLNVVVTTEAVDLFLKSDKVVMYRFLLDRVDKETYTPYPCSDVVATNSGIFTFKKFKGIPEERKYG